MAKSKDTPQMNGSIRLSSVELRILELLESDSLTYEELAIATGRKARSGMHRRVRRLIEMGYLSSIPGKSRRRKVTDDGKEQLRRSRIGAASRS